MSMKKRIQTERASQDLSADALSHVLTVAEQNVELMGCFLKASENITETVTITRVSADGGANYSYILSTDSLSGEQTSVYLPTGMVGLKRGDTLTVACTNANTTGTVYSEIMFREDI